MWLNLERTVDKRGRIAKKGHHFAMTKKKRSSVISGKMGVTPPVATPGDNQPQ